MSPHAPLLLTLPDPRDAEEETQKPSRHCSWGFHGFFHGYRSRRSKACIPLFVVLMHAHVSEVRGRSSSESLPRSVKLVCNACDSLSRPQSTRILACWSVSELNSSLRCPLAHAQKFTPGELVRQGVALSSGVFSTSLFRYKIAHCSSQTRRAAEARTMARGTTSAGEPQPPAHPEREVCCRSGVMRATCYRSNGLPPEDCPQPTGVYAHLYIHRARALPFPSSRGIQHRQLHSHFDVSDRCLKSSPFRRPSPLFIRTMKTTCVAGLCVVLPLVAGVPASATESYQGPDHAIAHLKQQIGDQQQAVAALEAEVAGLLRDLRSGKRELQPG